MNKQRLMIVFSGAIWMRAPMVFLINGYCLVRRKYREIIKGSQRKKGSLPKME